MLVRCVGLDRCGGIVYRGSELPQGPVLKFAGDPKGGDKCIWRVQDAEGKPQTPGMPLMPRGGRGADNDNHGL